MLGNLLASHGDSHTTAISTNGSITYGPNLPERTWPALLAQRLAVVTGQRWVENNVGKGGAATDHMAQFMDDALYLRRPEITTLVSGANDIGAGLTSSQSAQFMQAAAMMAMYECLGVAFKDPQGYWTNTGQGNGSTTPYAYVATEADLPKHGRPGQRFVVLADGSSTGGMPANAHDETLHTTITGSVSGAMTVWEYRNARGAELGYGRVARAGVTQPWHCQKIVIASSPYLNFPTSGDTPSTEKASLVAMRHAVQAVPAAVNVPVDGKPTVIGLNLYALGKARIDAGLDPDFSSVSYDDAKSWHCSDAGPVPNQHYNHYGYELFCQWFLDAIVNAGWVS